MGSPVGIVDFDGEFLLTKVQVFQLFPLVELGEGGKNEVLLISRMDLMFRTSQDGTQR